MSDPLWKELRDDLRDQRGRAETGFGQLGEEFVP